ncbi:MAG: ABC transporter permease subunit [Chloroflexota bacterium]
MTSPEIAVTRTRLGSSIRNHITAYLFLLPAGLLIFLFGIFPVVFAFFVSLHRWRRFPEGFRGLDQYVDAMGNFAFIAFMWIAVGLAIYGAVNLWRFWQNTPWRERGHIISGAVIVAFVIAFNYWFFQLLPIVLTIPQRLLGQQVTQSLFLSEFAASFTFDTVSVAAGYVWLTLVVMVAGLLVTTRLFKSPDMSHRIVSTTLGVGALVLSALLFWLTLTEINVAIAEAIEDGESLPVWSQIIIISAGALALGAAVWLWRRTNQPGRGSRSLVVRGLLVILLIIVAYALIIELPRALSNADDDMLQGFAVTVMFSVFSVPLQLALGLAGAVLLFSNIKAKAFFRMVYFLPYITPFAATSVIFSLIFSHRAESPANQFITALGIPEQNWLLEPAGIFQLMFGEGVPDALAGPGLALVVIIIYNVWVYAGYSSVIFLAGLGNIPRELYEAARIDGASGWHQFRHITLPLLSPTTFFLMLIATIGTFQAFTQIFLLRRPGSFDAVDTINLYIYEEIKRTTPDYAYGSALAFVLFAVILALTLVQNRIAGRKVFYG